jgi:hypothetical protein
MMPTPHRPAQPPAPKPPGAREQLLAGDRAKGVHADALRWLERLLRYGERAQAGAPPPDRDQAPPEKEVSS